MVTLISREKPSDVELIHFLFLYKIKLTYRKSYNEGSYLIQRKIFDDKIF